MLCYLVTFSGSNFLLDLDGEHEKFGFHATRLIKASSPAEIEKKALILIHQELNRSLHIVKNIPDAPKVIVKSVRKAGLLSRWRPAQHTGFEFYREAGPEISDQC